MGTPLQELVVRLCIELWDSFDACGVSSCGILGGETAATRVVADRLVFSY